MFLYRTIIAITCKKEIFLEIYQGPDKNIITGGDFLNATSRMWQSQLK